MFSFFVSFLQRSILTPARLWFPPVTGDESSGSVTVAQDVFLCRLRPRLSRFLITQIPPEIMIQKSTQKPELDPAKNT